MRSKNQQQLLQGFKTYLHSTIEYKILSYVRYEFQIVGAITSSLTQFCLQFSSYMLILYMLGMGCYVHLYIDLQIFFFTETLAHLAVDKGTSDTVTERINDFQFKSLWNSGIASGLSLCIAQYSAFKIQREHDLTIIQR